MVERAARALYADDNRYDEMGDGWERISDLYRKQWRNAARRVLAAALEGCEVRTHTKGPTEHCGATLTWVVITTPATPVERTET